MRQFLLMGIAAMAMVFTSCSKPTETIKSLQDAATGEANASAKYAAFAERAAADSLPRIAAMFRATSAAEAIHKTNHVAELAKLGVTFEPILEAVVVDSTLANLYAAKSGEEYEVQSMYPDMIAIAQKEGQLGAEQVFDWAMKAEVKHAQFYVAAIEALQNTGSDESVELSWVVCSTCGDTYIGGTQPAVCDLCGTEAEKFVTFN